MGPTDSEFNRSQNAWLWQGHFLKGIIVQDFWFLFSEPHKTSKIMDEESYLFHQILVKAKVKILPLIDIKFMY